MEIKIKLKRKSELSVNKAEMKKLIRDNYLNIYCNIDLAEIKSMFKNGVKFVKKKFCLTLKRRTKKDVVFLLKVPSYLRDRPAKQKKTLSLCS